nr:uncharacterized protein LOC117221056 [Megalopta genalis]
MSVGTKVSETTTCTSESDDGDYETSSEGHIRPTKGKSTGVDSAALLRSECDRAGPRSEAEESANTSSRRSSLIKSESMPLLTKSYSNEEDIDSGQVVQTSESSLARQRKIKVIVAKMAPLLSPWSNLSFATSVASKTNVNDEARKVESKMTILEVIRSLKTLDSRRFSRLFLCSVFFAMIMMKQLGSTGTQ